MINDFIGKVTKITGAKILVKINESSLVNKIIVERFISSYISVGSLVGTNLVDGRILIMTVEEIYDADDEVFITTTITGIYDVVTKKFSFGTNSYPLIGEKVFKVSNDILSHIFSEKVDDKLFSIGTYLYDEKVLVGYNPNVLFGKHLGVFGNTGSGKTCTVVSIIQHYIRENQEKNIKFIILDVNGEYKSAFQDSEADYMPFNQLRFHHSVLSNTEYSKLFRASEGVQYPALKDCIKELLKANKKWDLSDLSTQLEQWIKNISQENGFTRNQISGYLRTMNLRLDSILEDDELMGVINNADEEDTISKILSSDKKVTILDLQVSSDSLDIVVYLFFKAIYQHKSNRMNKTHICLVLEEAHRYINKNADESKLGNYYIDKLSREGRKFSIGLIIASQIPSMLEHDIISQCNSVIMHKITSRRDLEFLRNVMRISNDTFYLQMSALEKQHAVVCGEAFPNDSIVKIYEASPLPKSSDPIIKKIDKSNDKSKFKKRSKISG